MKIINLSLDSDDAGYHGYYEQDGEYYRFSIDVDDLNLKKMDYGSYKRLSSLRRNNLEI